MFGPKDFTYVLPTELIAQEPADHRDACRLMRLTRATGKIEHRVFSELTELLRPGDLLVLNDTRVIPGRFHVQRATGGAIEGLFLREVEPGLWSVLLKNAGRCRSGEELAFVQNSSHRLKLVRREEAGQWLVQPEPPAVAEKLLSQVGQTPLPPYIRRPGPMEDRADRQQYQTVYARVPGAVAAPTAGLHFTPRLLSELKSRGIEQAFVTLHVGLGTFAPVKVDVISQHKMHSEWYSIDEQAVAAIERTRGGGGRVIAVGTTAVRVLESAARGGLPLKPREGWTDIFIYPPAEFVLTDALITNFHLPASTLIMLAAAFCSPGRTEGRAIILDAYRRAVAERYRFFSYGDAMLIE